ncbi:MAG: IcmD [uncultured bacterium]|nr:MAG: IcmD [uncultured bacterium]
MLGIKNRFLNGELLIRLLIIIAGIFFTTAALAATTQLTLTTINSRVSAGIGNVVSIMQDVALVAGIGFIFSAFFKFHQHRQNPQQIPLSQGITLLVIGAGLTVFPHLLSTASQGVFGTGITKAGDTGIKSVVATG